MPRAQTTPDYRYSSWSVSRAINAEITTALQAMRECGPENEMLREHYGAVIRTLLRVHNYGLGRYCEYDQFPYGEHQHSSRPTIDQY